MKVKSKAIDILKTLSEDEFKSLGEFAESPYFNKDKSIVKLITELKYFYPQFDSKTLTEEMLYKKVFSKEKFNYSVMRNLMSGLLGVCEEFLLHNRIRNDAGHASEADLTLLDEYQLRQLDSLFDSRLRSFEKKLGLQKFDIDFYRTKVSLYNTVLEHEFNKMTFKDQMKNIFLDKALFELCGIANSLYRNANSIYFTSIEFGLNPDDNIFFRFLKCIDLKKFEKETAGFTGKLDAVIRLYLSLVYMLLHPDDEKAFDRAKGKTFDSLDSFSNIEKYSLLNILRNYLISENLKSGKYSRSDAKTINIEMLEKIDFKKDKLESVLGIIFDSVLEDALRSRDTKFASEIVSKYSGLLRKEIRAEVEAYSNASIAYLNGDCEKALEL